jgi:adenylosuccinate synthase
MSIKIIVGANWGDEGKGRMVDYFAQDADFAVRYQGGTMQDILLLMNMEKLNFI